MQIRSHHTSWGLLLRNQVGDSLTTVRVWHVPRLRDQRQELRLHLDHLGLALLAATLKTPLHSHGYLFFPPAGFDRGDHVEEPLLVNGVLDLAAGQERLELGVVDGRAEQGLRRELLEARDLDVADLAQLQQPLAPREYVTQERHAAVAERGQIELPLL